MIVKVKNLSQKLLSYARLIIVGLGLYGVTYCVEIRAASPITPKRPVPTLSTELSELNATLANWQSERKVFLNELQKFSEAASANLEKAILSSNDDSVIKEARILAQIEIWNSAFMADADLVDGSPKISDLPRFTSRDRLTWYASLLAKSGEKEFVEAVVTFARIPADAPNLIAKILNANETDAPVLFAELEERLKKDPKDPVVALTVETILRRNVGPEPSRSALRATANALVDQTPGTLRMYLLTAMQLEQRRKLEGMLNTSDFRPTGTLPDGSKFDPEVLEDKVIVVAFFAPQSAKCLAELPRLLDLHKDKKASGLEIINVISVQGTINFQDFIDNNPEVNWTQLVDPEAAQKGLAHPLARQTGVSTYPSYFLIDRKGVLRSVDAAVDLENLVNSLLEEK